MTHPLLIKVLNVLAYVFLLSANVYSGFEGESGGSPYHNSHETYITPAPFVFGVWGLIHLLLGGFVIYQFWESANEVVVDVVHWHFIIITLLNTLWLTLWTDEDPILLVKIVVVIALFILKGLSVAYIEGFDSDIAGSIVIAWTLVGIFVEQQDPIIHWTALVLAIISIFHIVKGLITLYRKSSRSGEYAPLNP
ncbi:28073_t:CDS:2 [Gigaspora margarita]|uniref:28073_t:CDS:1 n=1 Tax=Gigaspora margarita TaxID=4874 RepID=A0ABN7VNX6_GIGMA|nr:28073_t:CDS:2 [Gigaspora margarita]